MVPKSAFSLQNTLTYRQDLTQGEERQGSQHSLTVRGQRFYFYIVDEELRHKKEFYSWTHSDGNGIVNAHVGLVSEFAS